MNPIVELVLSLFINLSILQGDVAKKPASLDQNQATTTQSAKPTTTTTERIGSGGWDEKN